MNTSKALYIFMAFILGCLVGWSVKSHICKRQQPIVKTTVLRDTIMQIKTDTLVSYKPIYKYTQVVDTAYINDTIVLPIEQKYYSKPNIYDLWVSGYSVNLDSIKTYSKTIERYINTTTTTVVYKQSWDFYPYIGIRRFDSKIKPSFGLIIKSPKKWIIGGEFGLNSNNNTYYGMNIGYKIGK